MARKLQDIFNECCERLLQGETVEDCLKSYPKEAARLEPLLKVASNVHKKATSFQARPEFKEQTRTRLERAFLHTTRLKQARAKVGFGWQRSWVLAVTIILVVLVVGAGTVAASTQALPNEPLYPVKLATEQATLTLTFSDITKAELHARLAERRAWEIAQMARQGQDIQIAKVVERLTTHLEQAEACAYRAVTAEEMPEAKTAPTPLTATVPPSDRAAKVKKFLEDSAPRSIAALELALEQAPEQAKPALRHAIEMTKKGYEKALEKTEERGKVPPKSPVPPTQPKKTRQSP